MISGENILLIVSERLGDCIFCTPAIGLLRASLPHVKIAVLAPTITSAQVFEFNPAVNKCYIAPDKQTVKQFANDYDTTIDLQDSGITRKYVKWLKKATFISPRSGYEHQSKVAFKFIQSLLAVPINDYPENYQLYPQLQHKAQVEKLLAAQVNLTEDILIGCHMGHHGIKPRLKLFGRYKLTDGKLWPLEKFAELQHQLYKSNPNIKLVLTGVPAEQGLTKIFDKNIPNIVNLMGQTSILELAALMHYLRVFLTGCTGPLHIAAAAEIPIVAFYGSTMPEYTGPYPRKLQHIILRAHPLNELDIDTVMTALLKFL